MLVPWRNHLPREKPVGASAHARSDFLPAVIDLGLTPCIGAPRCSLSWPSCQVQTRMTYIPGDTFGASGRSTEYPHTLSLKALERRLRVETIRISSRR